MCKVLGVGVDLCAISRMQEQLTHEHFMARCFTAQEQAYIAARSRRAADSAAGLWAAKEAALKALGVGIVLPLTDVEIVHTDKGQPQYALHGKALDMVQDGSMALSISHEGNMAIAFCVWSGE